MGLKKTNVDKQTLQTESEIDGVGELGLSQTDTSCQRYEATVLSLASSEDGGYLLEVDRSPLFPGGGGQPADRGWVDGQPVHEVIDHQRLRLMGKPNSECVVIELDWAHRFDMMQQHTGQHVISALAQKHYGWSTLSFHLSVDSAFVVLECHAPTPKAVQRLEDDVNKVIRGAHDVEPRLATDADFSNKNFRCRKLPDVRSGGLRLVDIDGIDLNTCGGTHVSNTAALQMVRFIKCEPHRGATRLFFEVGGRVLQRARSEAVIHHEVNQLLSCAVSQYPESIGRVLKDLKQAAKHIKSLELSVAELEARQWPIAEGDEPIIVHTNDREMAQLTKMAQVMRARVGERECIFLSRLHQDDWIILIVGQDDWIQNQGRALIERLNGRGGGGKGRLQGKLSSDQLVFAYLEEMGVHG